MAIVCRPANPEDWSLLAPFYRRIYPEGHPLQNREFWMWQYGDARHGQAFIVEDAGKVAGHLGASFGGGYAWVINVFLDPEYRGQGWVNRLYAAARERAPLAATNINEAGLGMYRHLGFIRYCDLQRYVQVRPGLDPDQAIQKATLADLPAATGNRYWEQPGIDGVELPDASSAVAQHAVGGLRLISIADPEAVAEHCWDAGAAWADFVTSWNDPLCRSLAARGWTLGDPIPWRLNPPLPGSESRISFVSERPIDPTLIVSRDLSDHGRVGSLPATPLQPTPPR